MTISSALNAGVSGLSANSTRLATIADNIANSATSGYRRVETDFNSMVLSSGGGSYTAGGVSVANFREIDQRGSIVSTSNATDLAVSGEGLLPVMIQTEYEADGNDAQLLFTTTGGFYENEDGYLVTQSGYMLLGWAADVDGTIPTVVRESQEDLEPVQITSSLTSDPTTNVALNMNMNSDDTEYGDGTVADTHYEAIEYYDNLGSAEDLTFSFVPSIPASSTDDATNTWTMTITDSADNYATIAEYTIVFSDDSANGGLIESVATTSATYPDWDATTGLIELTVGTGTATNSITLDIGSQYDTNGFTQLSADTQKTSSDVDGSEVGERVGFDIDESGFVNATFDTGVSKVLYQIPLAVFPNVNGLDVMSNQTFAGNNDSGSYYFWDAGDGPTTGITSYALEESAVDVAEELTNLIQTQRAYTSNAKVITTVDEMLQETANLKR